MAGAASVVAAPCRAMPSRPGDTERPQCRRILHLQNRNEDWANVYRHEEKAGSLRGNILVNVCEGDTKNGSSPGCESTSLLTIFNMNVTYRLSDTSRWTPATTVWRSMKTGYSKRERERVTKSTLEQQFY